MTTVQRLPVRSMHEPALRGDELQRLLRDALEQPALVELVGEPGRGGEQVIERIGLSAELLAQRALALDGALGCLARPARAQGEHREHAESDREQCVQRDLVHAHVGATCPVPAITIR